MAKNKRRKPGVSEQRIKSVPRELVDESLTEYTNKLPEHVEVVDRKLGYDLSYRVNGYKSQQINIIGGVTPDILRAIADDLSDRIKTGLYKGCLVDSKRIA